MGKTTVAAATAVRCADAGARTHRALDRPGPLAGRRVRRRRSAAGPTPVVDGPLGPAARRPGADGGGLGRHPGLARRGVRVGRGRRRRGRGARRPARASTRSSPWPTSRPTPTSGEWDVIVVDCAPTAETIRLLSLPDVLALVHGAGLPDRAGGSTRLVGPVLSPGDEPAGGRRRRVRLGRALLRPARRGEGDPRRHRAHQRPAGRQPRADGDRRGPAHVHLPVAVRLPASTPSSPTACCPTTITDPWFDRWKATPRRAPRGDRGGLRAAAGPAGRAGRRGARRASTRLRAFAAGLYGDARPGRRPPRRRAARGSRPGATTSCSLLELPFADRDDLDLGRHDDELLVRVGPYRRAIVLPDSLRRRPGGGGEARATAR